MLVSYFCGGVLDAMMFNGYYHVFYYIFALALMLPTISAGVRRLHDTNHNGWWLLVPIYNIVLLCMPSDEGVNEYGELC